MEQKSQQKGLEARVSGVREEQHWGRCGYSTEARTSVTSNRGGNRHLPNERRGPSGCGKDHGSVLAGSRWLLGREQAVGAGGRGGWQEDREGLLHSLRPLAVGAGLGERWYHHTDLASTPQVWVPTLSRPDRQRGWFPRLYTFLRNN